MCVVCARVEMQDGFSHLIIESESGEREIKSSRQNCALSLSHTQIEKRGTQHRDARGKNQQRSKLVQYFGMAGRKLKKYFHAHSIYVMSLGIVPRDSVMKRIIQ